jgi:hypothetical protein
MKPMSFFELKNRMKLEATEELIKLMEKKHCWKKLAELIKFREELRGSKNDQAAAAGEAI